MNSDTSQPPPEHCDREARLTALLLGELPAAEAESFRAEIASDPELTRLLSRLRLTLELARQTVRESGTKEPSDPLQLSPDRRAALFARFREGPANVVPLPGPVETPAFNRREFLAVAAMLVVLLGAGALMVPTLISSARKHPTFVAAADLTAEAADFSARTLNESLEQEPKQRQLTTAVDFKSWASRSAVESRQKRIEDETTRQPVPPAPQMEPMLAKRYGLSPASGTTFQGRLPSSTRLGQPDANAAPAAGATRPASAGDTLSDLASAQEPRGGSRPAADESKSHGLAGANFDSKSDHAGSNGRESALVQNQIVLPAPEQRETWDDRPAVSFFEQAPQAWGRGVGAGGGGATGNRWFLPQRPDDGVALGGAPAAVAMGFSPDGSKVPAAGAGATPNQAGLESLEKSRPDDAGVKLAESTRSNPVDATRFNLGKEMRPPGDSKQQDAFAKDKLAQVDPAWETRAAFGGGAGFGTAAGIQPNFAGFQPAPPPGPTSATGLPVDAPARDVSLFTTAPTADGAIRELNAELAPPEPAATEERLRRAGKRVAAEDRKAGGSRNESLASAEPAPGADARGEIVAAAPSINGPETSARSFLSLDRSGVAISEFEGLGVQSYKSKAETPVDRLSTANSPPGSTPEQADKPHPSDDRERPAQALVNGVLDGAPAESPKLTTLSSRERFGQSPGEERFRRIGGQAGSAPADRGASEKTADLSDWENATVAGKPADRFASIALQATNAAPSTFGDQPVLGDAFGIQLDSPAAGVGIIQPASAEPEQKLGLFAKLRQTFGGDATRTARLKIEKDTPDVGQLGATGATPPTYDPYHLLSEQEVIRSRKILGEAAKRLNLSTEVEDGFQQLEGKVSVHQYGNTSIAEIQAKDSDPAKAAAIANTVAQVYAEYRDSIQTAKKAANQAASNERELARLVADRQAQLAETPAPEVDRPLPKLAPGAPEPQPEVLTADNAFSTFSLNVSDVSFKLAAASLEKGQMPDPTTVRTEEFINAFDYRDPEPVGAAPIAFAWERARYPFAHDRDLLRFSVKTAASGRQPGRPLNLVLLLDNSGSMERADRVRIRQECLRVLAGQLQPQDRVSVVAFARSARLWVDALPGSQAAELPGRVGELAPDGGTNLEEALRLAYQTAARHFTASGVNRVVLLTDGAANLGDVQPDSLKQQVEANRRQGIALDCFGIGWEGFNDELLEVLSRNGDGRYGFVNTPEAAVSEFAGQLVGALQVAASDVKVQVEWNPRRVTAYRQLGYAKHQLTKEQFRDNTVDAAEIGAAEAGNALYTVRVNPSGEGPLGTVRVRFRVPGTGNYREHEWPLNYTGAAGTLEHAGPALRLAGCASAFSEWLVSSPYAAEVTPDRLLGLLPGVTDAYAADPRPKQFEQMLRHAKSLTGK